MNHTPYTKRYSLTIGWLYPDLMNTYGDRGNIITLQKRCEWRGIDIQVLNLNPGFNYKQLATCDMLFMGGAQDRQQKIVSDDFTPPAGGDKIKALKKAVEEEVPGLYICGAYQFLGKYYKEADGTVIPGLGILDLYTENPGKERLIGNIIITPCHPFGSEPQGRRPELARPERGRRVLGSRDSDIRQNDKVETLVGFENHGGRTYLGKNLEPLGKVISGSGNNGEDGTEGCVYKNSFGTYLHGPILPKNPHLADLLIKLALEKKYKSPINLSPLNDSLEHQAYNLIAKRLKVKL
ncbi:MAG: hypothetical protein Q8P80_01220 [Candidatus Levybacteria bacterium]|nr:hypothetical protein [Candidatus Levybacteria bacterium]